MSLKKLFAIGATALLLTTPALQAGVLYDCKVAQKSGPKGWVSSRVGIVIDDEGAAQIVDSLTLYFETGPRPARVKKRGDDLKLSWSFSALTDDSNQFIPGFNFQATLNTVTGAFKMRGRPPRFPESVSGTGTCETRSSLSTKQLNRLLRQNSG